MTMTSYPLTVPMPVLKLPLLTTDPLTAGELFSNCEVRIVALPLAPAMDAPGAVTLGEVGGLGAWLKWEGLTIALPGFGQPLTKVKKNSERVGVHYQLPHGGAKKTVNGAEYEEWLKAAHASVALPLSQAPDHYAPVDDIVRSVAVNAAWGAQTPTGWGVVQGEGLKAARQESIAHLVEQNITNFYLGGFEQPLEDEEWQRSLEMTTNLLPPNGLVMVEAATPFRIQAAIETGIHLIISDLPLTLARHHRYLQEDLSDVPVEEGAPHGLPKQAWSYLTERHVGLATRLLTEANVKNWTAYFAKKHREMLN